MVAMTPTTARLSASHSPRALAGRRAGIRLAALLFGVVLVGCGGGGDEGQPAPGSLGTNSVDVAADRATARTLLLESSDFPAGWSETPWQTDPLLERFEDEVYACLGLPNRDAYITADTYSAVFSKGNAQAVSNAQIVETTEDFAADFAIVAGPRYAPCLQRGLRKLLPRQVPDASLQSLTTKPLQVANYGKLSRGWRITATLVIQGQSVIIYLDDIALGKGRIELGATFSNIGRPFEPALRRALVAALGDRLEAA